MSSNQYYSGQTHGQAKATAEHWVESAKDTANAAQNKAAEAHNKAADSPGQAQQQRDEASNFLQQTGEQMASMAQGAIDGVKNTLGVGESQQKK